MNMHIPTIASSAMLVELGLASWSARKLDKKASEDVVRSNNANKGVARVNKDLLGNCSELTAIHKYDANLRSLHYRYTLPWSDTNPARLLPLKAYDTYVHDMSRALQEREKLIDAFISAYDWEIAQARVKLGDLFDPNEYPSRENVRSRFRSALNFLPMPDSGNWLLDASEETARMLRTQCEQLIGERVKFAMSDVWSRLHDALSRMSERLDYSDDAKKIFRDSLVDNVHEVIDVLKVANLTGDPAMEEARQRLEIAMKGVSPEGLREDAGLRRQTKSAVDDIMKGLPTLGW